MAKDFIIRLIQSEEVSLSVLNAIRRIGGIENLTEAEAEKLVKRFKLEPKPVDPEAVAYDEYRSLQRSREFWLGLRAEIGEAHDFGEMCGYDDTHDEESRRRYNTKIEEIEARMAELKPLANRHARYLNVTL